MEVKSGYKQTEVGVIPNEWETLLLKDLFIFKNGLNKAKEFFGYGTPIVNYMDVYRSRGMYSGELKGRVSLGRDELKAFNVRKGDVFFTRTSETADEVGISSVMLDEPEATVFSGFVLRARPKDDSLDNEFKKYCFSTDIVRKQITSQSTETTRALTNGRSLGAVAIARPPIAEQRSIAEALSDVDALLGGLDRLIAKKRDLKQAAMRQLLTGQTRLPGFHGEWEVKTLSKLFNFSGGYSASRDQLSSEGHCYLHYGDIHGATKTTVDVRADYQNIPKLDIPLKRVASKSLLEDGDVVFVDASEDDEGTSRHVVVVNEDKKPFISGLHTIVAKSKTDELAHEYRRYCFQTAAMRQQFLFYAVGTKVSGISKTNIAKLKMPVPKVPEQIAIAEVLSEMDLELAALEQRREKTHAIKQGMMQQLLTGRIRLVKPEQAEANA
jgi:type I restriction enzyme, S subunit